MKKEKQPLNLINKLKEVIKLKKSSKKDSKPKHQPSWMYRNE